jgi:ABC-type sugar transport system ATPase subunit
LMDEPLSNLDAKLRVQMRTEVSRIQRRLGTTTVYVTHDQTEAMTMGDRVAVLREGVLQQVADPQELYEQPANLFVASFIGSPAMNLYEATVTGPADRLVLSLGSQQITLPADLGQRRPALAASQGRKLVVGIRPEHLTVPFPAADAEAVRDETLFARAELVESLGNELLLHFSTDARIIRNRGGVFAADTAAQASGEISGVSATEGVARVDPRVRIRVGDRVALALDVGRLHFFDIETGEAIQPADVSHVVPLRPSRT